MVDRSDPEQVKAYYRLYYLANREKILKKQKAYDESHKEEVKAYQRNIVTKFFKYIGVCICEKCGLKGYKRYDRPYNKKTGNYGKTKTRVLHQHKESGKTVYDGCCYIGMGEL